MTAGNRRTPRYAVVRAAASAAVGSLVCGVVLLSGSAHAALQVVPENGAPGRLVLSSDPYPAQLEALSPGVIRYWEVTATIEGSSDASLVLEIWKDGDLVEHPEGLVATVERCDVAWTGVPDSPRCPAGWEVVTDARPSDDYSTVSPVFDLHGVDPVDGTHLLVGIGLESTDARDESLMGLSGDIGLGLTAAAEDPSTPGQPSTPGRPIGIPLTNDLTRPTDTPAGGLPVTGADPIGLLLAALGALGLGVTALATRGRGATGDRTAGSTVAARLTLPSGRDDV
ncbi:hypothetical protein ELQ92_14390 [Labedella populi]|uniref:Uncharacterized protein n=1 Tax=Labedella populi TaxID=2498850 RepID=A0A444Q3V9_9MICO|nr:hypothetical protein [Labedella populi]RWZ58488.1 hypothetical protein ELQ92_14390 [Labedella populi]